MTPDAIWYKAPCYCAICVYSMMTDHNYSKYHPELWCDDDDIIWWCVIVRSVKFDCHMLEVTGSHLWFGSNSLPLRHSWLSATETHYDLSMIGIRCGKRWVGRSTLIPVCTAPIRKTCRIILSNDDICWKVMKLLSILYCINRIRMKKREKKLI